MSMTSEERKAWMSKRGRSCPMEYYDEDARKGVLDELRFGTRLCKIKSMPYPTIDYQRHKYPEFDKAIIDIRKENHRKQYELGGKNPLRRHKYSIGEIYVLRLDNRTIKFGWCESGNLEQRMRNYKSYLGYIPELLFHAIGKTMDDDQAERDISEPDRVQGTKDLFYSTVKVMNRINELRGNLAVGEDKISV